MDPINHHTITTWIEGAQIVVGVTGLWVALREWRAVMAFRAIDRPPLVHRLADHAVLVEVLRALVHLIIVLTAGLSFVLPPVPQEMPEWIVCTLTVRKVGLLVIAVIATVGTWSSARMRRAIVRDRGWGA